jgi:hypothetical protein
MREAFRRFAGAITTAVGTPWALLLAIGIVAAWALSGPVFGFSDTWQLAINTGTTIVTFLMVFVIQASQNRDSRACTLRSAWCASATASAVTPEVRGCRRPPLVVTSGRVLGRPIPAPRPLR